MSAAVSRRLSDRFGLLALGLRLEPAGAEQLEGLLVRGLRLADRLEAYKCTGLQADLALRLTLTGAAAAWSVSWRGRPFCLFGVNPPGMGAKGWAVPWLVAHSDFERPGLAVLLGRLSRHFTAEWLNVFGRLENVCDPGHGKNRRFLSWLGFSFDWDTPCRGPHGHRLIRFWQAGPVSIPGGAFGDGWTASSGKGGLAAVSGTMALNSRRIVCPALAPARG